MKSILETFWCSWLLYKHMSLYFNGRSRDRPDPAVGGGGGTLRVVLIVFTTFFFPFLISERKKLEEKHQQNHQLKQQ